MELNKKVRDKEKFYIQRLICRGEKGNVYQAIDIRADKVIVVKTLDNSLTHSTLFTQRFRTDCDRLMEIEHDNIVKIFSLEENGHELSVLSEFIKDGNLSEWIKTGKMMHWPEFFSIFKQLLSALGHCHRHELVHRNLKPQNVFITRDGEVKLTDFGLVPVKRELHIIISQNSIENLGFMAPEQFETGNEADPRTDIYACGILMYYTLTGQTPFSAIDNRFNIYRAISKGKIRSPHRHNSAIPSALVKVIMTAIDRRPEQRFQSMEDMLEALQEAETAAGAMVDKPTVNYSNTRTVEQFPGDRHTISTMLQTVREKLAAAVGSVDLSRIFAPYTYFFSRLAQAFPERTTRLGALIALSGIIFLLVFFYSSGDPQEDAIPHSSASGEGLSGAVTEPPPTFSVSISTQPEGAAIFVNDNPAGVSPIQDFATAAGSIRLNIRKENFQPIDTTVAIDTTTTQLRFRLRAKAPRAAVTEKAPLATAKTEPAARAAVTQKAPLAAAKTEPAAGAAEKKPLAAEKPPAPAFGKLSITSSPEEAVVLIDGRSSGKTPLSNLELSPGEHSIKIHKKGYQSYTETFTVEADQSASISADLAPLTGTLTVSVKANSTVSVAGKKYAAAKNGTVKLDLPAGMHQVTVRDTVLNATWQKQVNIKADQSSNINVDFDLPFTVVVASKPSWGEIFVDGEASGSYTPKKLKLRPGLHTIEVRREGFVSEGGAKTINLDSDLSEPLVFSLKKQE